MKHLRSENFSKACESIGQCYRDCSRCLLAIKEMQRTLTTQLLKDESIPDNDSNKKRKEKFPCWRFPELQEAPSIDVNPILNEKPPHQLEV